MIKILRLSLAIAVTLLGISRAETGAEQYLETGESCAKAQEPGICMESYGFQCHQSRRHGESIDAQMLGCNLDLGDGRKHFVQMLFNNGEWNVETESTYWPEYSEAKTPEEDSALALSSYIQQEMKGYSMHSSGGGTNDLNLPQEFQTGARRNNGHVAVRIMCGVVFGLQLDETASTQTKSDCQSKLLYTVKKLSQPQGTGPYRVAAPSEFEWERRFARLISGDTALILEGRYIFSKKHVPCLWISDCCSTEGYFYLDSCRAPTESELQIIESCLEEVERLRSEEFTGCLSAASMEVGCEDQADGSRICF